jgi:hypothetical protein
MIIPIKIRVTSIILKVSVFISAFLGVFLSAYASKDVFMGGSTVFMFFTIQSNIAIALISFVGIFFLVGSKPVNRIWYVIKFVGTVSITLTGVVFTFVLAPTLGEYAWNIQNILTHVIVPAVSIIDFFITGIYGNIAKRNIIFVIVPPVAYAVYAGIGYALGWEFAEGINYPYFFLNWGSPAGAFGFSDTLPFMGTMWWIFALLIFLIAVGYVYLLIINIIKKTMERKQDNAD